MLKRCMEDDIISLISLYDVTLNLIIDVSLEGVNIEKWGMSLFSG